MYYVRVDRKGKEGEINLGQPIMLWAMMSFFILNLRCVILCRIWEQRNDMITGEQSLSAIGKGMSCIYIGLY